MGRLNAPLLALALAAGALGLAACGSGDDDLLPGSTAGEITANLDQVKELATAGDCVGAGDAAAAVSVQIDELGGVDAKLKEALREGATRLNEVVATCEEAEVEEDTPAIAPAEEPEEEEPKQKPEKPTKPEKPEKPEKEEAAEETTPTPPSQAEGKAKGHEQPEETTPPAETGGGTPAGGVEPSTPVEGE